MFQLCTIPNFLVRAVICYKHISVLVLIITKEKIGRTFSHSFSAKETNDILEIHDKNFKHLPKETQSAINLLHWAKSSIKMSDVQLQDYKNFNFLVENAECEGSAVDLPLPPVFLITDMFN